MDGLWQAYLQSLETSPRKTQLITGLVIGGLSSVASQSFFESKKVDWEAVSRRAAIQGAMNLFMFKYYGYLNKMLEGKPFLVKIILDQGIGSWLINSAYLVFNAIFNNRVGHLSDDFKALPTIVTSGWVVWPLANTVSFNYVNPNLQPLFSSVVAFFWGIFLNLKTKNK